MSASSSTPPPLISVTGVSKSFGAVRALRDVDVTFLPGEVHGLVGANGAGKSTLLNVVGGAIRPDAGRIEVAGAHVEIQDPRAAAELGLSFIWQELALVPAFAAWENMTLGLRARTFMGVGDRRSRRSKARDIADRLGLQFDLDRLVNSLSIAERGMVAIARALVGEARFLSMDEPTASLSDVECERLFTVVRELAASGVSIAYVSHRLKEIEDLCDRVTVFKEGQVAGAFERGEYSRRDLILSITGAKSLAEAQEPLPDAADRAAVPVLEVRGIRHLPRVIDVSLTLHRGEILGLAGVVGAGRTEVARVIFGADRMAAGEMTLFGSSYSPRHVGDAIDCGVALVPEERRSQALVMEESITSNLNMGNWTAMRRWRALPFVSGRKARRTSEAMVERLSIKTDGVAAQVKTLSGGNQQKVVFGRWLSREAKILVLDEPTRGVDVGARHQIWQATEAFAAAGNAVLVICSELEELAVCHRIVVMVEGRNVAEIRGPGVTEEQMNELIYTAQSEQEAS